MVFEAREITEKYVKNPETFLNHIEDRQKRMEALEWLLQSDETFQTFSLANQTELVRDNPIVLSYSSLQNVISLDISNCDLTRCPHLNYLHRLQILNISNNKLRNLTEIEKCRSLKSLDIAANPIVEVACDTDLFENLTKLRFGSEETRFISTQILHRKLTNELNLLIPEMYWTYLLCPSARILEDSQMSEMYIKKPEIALKDLDIKDKIQAFEWMISKLQMVEIDLSNMSDLFAADKEMFAIVNRLKMLKVLKLRGCLLDTFPNVNEFPCLMELDLSYNCISFFQMPELLQLESLDLTGNPIVSVDFDITKFPSLHRLSCGSEVTRYIALSTLQSVVERSLEISIPSQFEKNLMLPPYASLRDHDLLIKFLGHPETFINEISSDQKEEVLQWLIDQRQFSSFDLSNQADICKIPNQPNLLLNKEQLAGIIILNLSHCRLQDVPDLSHLHRLEVLNIESNNITSINLVHPQIKYLNITDNVIEMISIDTSKIPCLKRVKCGSSYTKYISLDTVHTSKVGRIHIEVKDKYRCNLLLPQFIILENDQLLGEYLRTPEKYISNILDIDYRCKALFWLSGQHGDSFKSFTLDGQKEVCDRVGMDGLQQILNKLPLVRILSISNCGLKTPIDVTPFANLKHLDISRNNIEELPESFCNNGLETLSICENPIAQVDPKNFVNLLLLICGSTIPWHMTYPTLRRIADEELVVDIPLEFQKTLLYPKYDILAAGPMAVRDYIYKKDLDLSGMQGLNDDLSLYQSIVNKAEKPVKSIRLSNVHFTSVSLQNLLPTEKLRQGVEHLYMSNCNIEEYPEQIGLPHLSHVDLSDNPLSGNFYRHLPESVSFLTARNCNLSELPTIDHLLSLDIRKNKIQNLNVCIVFHNLEYLYLANNPIDTIDFDSTVFPKLRTLTFGSKLTRFVSNRILSFSIKKGLLLKLEEPNSLLLPPSRVLNTPDLAEYVHNPEKYLTELDDKIDALIWLVEKDIREDVTSFSLSNQKRLCLELGVNRSTQMLSSGRLVHIQSLHLDNCGVQQVPEIERLFNLSELSVRNNEIENIDNIRHAKLSQLMLSGNPLRILDFSTTNLPALKTVEFGSPVTQTISNSVLEKVAFGQLEIEVPRQYRQYLMAPQYSVIGAGACTLKRYLNKYEADFSKEFVGEISSKDLAKLVTQRFDQCIKVLKLNGQTNFKNLEKILQLPPFAELKELHLDGCDLAKVPDVRSLKSLEMLSINDNIIENLKPIQTGSIHSLYLKNCKLETMPSISQFPRLKHLDISSNRLAEDSVQMFEEKLDKPHPLQMLDLSGNNIKAVNINVNSFPQLQHLTCGSPVTRYISWSLLKAVSTGFIDINVPDAYKKHLLIPPSELLDNPQDSLGEYLTKQKQSLTLTHIPDINGRYEAFRYLLEQTNIQYTELNLSRQGDFCESLYLPKILNHAALSNISSLYLNNCGLKFLSLDSKSLPELEHLDISYNELTEIRSILKSHPNLQRLYLEGNPIETIQIDDIKINFPNLKYIIAGSEYTYYIAALLLKIIYSGELIIDFVYSFRKFLIMPPYEVLKEGPDALKVYTLMLRNDPKKVNTNPRNVLKDNTTDNVLVFLGAIGAGKTSLLHTLKENKSKLTSLKSRTVILDRDVLDLGHGITIATLDFGGDSIYELEYPLFLRGQNIIALILVDFSIYNETNHDELVTKWLYNCVLSVPCKVLFIPSKIDQLSSEEVEQKTELLKTLMVKTLNNESIFLSEVAKYIDDHNLPDVVVKRDQSMPQHLESDRIKSNLKFFKTFEVARSIIPISSMDMTGLVEIKSNIRQLVEVRQAQLPASWNEMFQFVRDYKSESSFPVCMPFTEAQKCYLDNPDFSSRQSDSIEACIRYFSNKGIILWYPEQGEYIFNNLDNILKLHKELFRHDLAKEFVFRESYKRFIPNERQFNLQKNNFINHGLLDRSLLKCLWASYDLSDNELEAMIALWKVNNHCFEENPEQGENSAKPLAHLLRFPWFIKQTTFMGNNWPDSVPDEQLELCYVYTFFRILPSALYERISVRLQYILAQGHIRKDWTDGIYAQVGNVKLLLQRNTEDPKFPQLTIRLRAPVNDLLALWKLCFDSYASVVDSLAGESTLRTYKKVFICPHCILTGQPMETAHKLPLREVMESRCDDYCYTQCPKSENPSQGPTVVPAAIHRPLIQGKKLVLNVATKIGSVFWMA